MEIVIILLLIAANGIFAMAEIAVVSLRKARLNQMAENGHKSAATALSLAENPDDFLSTVQVGITLIGPDRGAALGVHAAVSRPYVVAALAQRRFHVQVQVPFARVLARLLPIRYAVAVSILITVQGRLLVSVGLLRPIGLLMLLILRRGRVIVRALTIALTIWLRREGRTGDH